MRIDEERLRLTGNDTGFGVLASGWLGRLLTLTAGAALLVVGFMFSLLVLAVLVTGGLVVLGYLWWKTRELRRQLRERPPGGRVIEGVSVREAGSRDRIQP